MFAKSQVVDFADYGVPQHRKRLITICIHKKYTLDDKLYDDILHSDISNFHCLKSHGSDLIPYVNLRQSIGHLPPLDAMTKLQDDDYEYHRIPKWNQVQYYAMSHTPEGCTAFENNKCIHCKLDNDSSVLF